MRHGSSITFYPLGEAAIVIQFGEAIDEQTNRLVASFSRHLETRSIPGMIEQVPALNSITLFYDVLQQDYTEIEQRLRNMLDTFEMAHTDPGRIVEIPVCYGGDFGSDLSHVADYHNLSEEEVIRIHAEPLYSVYMIGFAPGFPYLGGLSEKIATPRRESPRAKIPVGSVGIAGAQTGIYSISTPGGWQLIGRTPTELFQPAKDPPSLLQAGDRIRFIPISREAFRALKGIETE